MEEKEKAIQLLKRLRGLVSPSGPQATYAVYYPPATQLRRAADELEAKDALLREVDEFLSSLTS